MPLSHDEPRMWLPTGRSLYQIDLRAEPLPGAPSGRERHESRPDGALLHVPPDASYMSGADDDVFLSHGRVAVRGRCLGATGGFGVAARVRMNDDWMSGYTLLIHPDTRSYSLSDFRVSPGESITREIVDWQVSDRIRGTGESNLVELRHVGSTLQVFLNGFLVDEVVDNRHDSGLSAWVVRAYETVCDVLLEQMEVSEVTVSAPEAELSPGRLIELSSAPVDSAGPDGAPTGAEAVERALLGKLTSELDAMPDRLVSPEFWIGRFRDPGLNPLAAMPNCAPAMLTALARSPRVALRRVVAAHPRCPDETLARLAADAAAPVRLSVACRLDCPASLLERLASDEHAMVREAVASHALVPALLHERLALDPDETVRAAVARHPGCPPELRARLGASTDPAPAGRPRAERVWFPGHVEPRGPKPRSPS